MIRNNTILALVTMFALDAAEVVRLTNGDLSVQHIHLLTRVVSKYLREALQNFEDKRPDPRQFPDIKRAAEFVDRCLSG